MKYLLIFTFVAVLLGGISCKEKSVSEPDKNNKVDFSRSINLMDTNPKSRLGLVMQVAEWKLDLMVFGTKNASGILKKADQLFFFNPANDAWLLVDLSDRYPEKITTHTGTVIAFSNYNRANLTADIYVKNAEGKAVQTYSLINYQRAFLKILKVWKRPFPKMEQG